MRNLIARLAHLRYQQQANILLSLESQYLEMALKLLTSKLGTPQAIVLATHFGNPAPVFQDWDARLRLYLSGPQHDAQTTSEFILEGLRLGVYSDEEAAQAHISFYLALLVRRGNLVPFWNELVNAIGLQKLKAALETDTARQRLGDALDPLLTELRAL